ncbi:MAG TPA: cupin domain-containing protein [Burkholderiales bacterium]|nr:cupin domain-containing protein [Burkholderiales bacterium]
MFSYFVKQAELAGYHPANHTGTTNYRLIGSETAGARNIEVILGVIEPGQGALPHRHPGIEQVCYILEGRAMATVAEQSRELGPGDCCFFPADVQHVFKVIGETPVKVLVIYSPPYGESPDKVVATGER